MEHVILSFNYQIASFRHKSATVRERLEHFSFLLMKTENIAPAVQPDISYHPDELNYKQRTARRLVENPELPLTPLPSNFPQKVEGPIVWEGKDWISEAQWVFRLTPAHLQEIDDALVHFKGLSISYSLVRVQYAERSLGLEKALGYISKETFPLPTLSAVLDSSAHELYSGRGFFVLRTIPIDDYSKNDLAIIYAGKQYASFKVSHILIATKSRHFIACWIGSRETRRYWSSFSSYQGLDS